MDFSSTASTLTASSMDNSTFRSSATLAYSYMAKRISKVKRLANNCKGVVRITKLALQFKKPTVNSLFLRALLGVALVTIVPTNGRTAGLASIWLVVVTYVYQ